MTYQEFIENLHSQAELQAEAKIREEYVRRPHYKKMIGKDIGIQKSINPDTRKLYQTFKKRFMIKQKKN